MMDAVPKHSWAHWSAALPPSFMVRHSSIHPSIRSPPFSTASTVGKTQKFSPRFSRHWQKNGTPKRTTHSHGRGGTAWHGHTRQRALPEWMDGKPVHTNTEEYPSARVQYGLCSLYEPLVCCLHVCAPVSLYRTQNPIRYSICLSTWCRYPLLPASAIHLLLHNKSCDVAVICFIMWECGIL